MRLSDAQNLRIGSGAPATRAYLGSTLVWGTPPAAAILQQSSGVAARNGTASHTISFGWTAGSGTLVTLILFGAVTHAISGWSERLAPVNSGELSVFTVAGAGQSSATVTHNGADYAVHWVALETPGAWVGGSGSSSADDVMPAVAGLPGTPVTVIAAHGRVSATATDAASASWSGMTELYDLVTPKDTTDGGWLTVAYLAGVTASSYAPSLAASYTSWGSPGDRQHVTFAVT